MLRFLYFELLRIDIDDQHKEPYIESLKGIISKKKLLEKILFKGTDWNIKRCFYLSFVIFFASDKKPNLDEMVALLGILNPHLSIAGK